MLDFLGHRDRLSKRHAPLATDRLWQTLSSWMQRKSCTRRDLESLISTLQHACRVVRSGRTSFCRMIDLLRVPRSSFHHVHLNREFRADLWWWSAFASHWNGVSFFPPPPLPAIGVTTAASGEWECGAWSKGTGFSSSGQTMQSTTTLHLRNC